MPYKYFISLFQNIFLKTFFSNTYNSVFFFPQNVKPCFTATQRIVHVHAPACVPEAGDVHTYWKWERYAYVTGMQENLHTHLKWA
jgi:hypothetical protein